MGRAAATGSSRTAGEPPGEWTVQPQGKPYKSYMCTMTLYRTEINDILSKTLKSTGFKKFQHKQNQIIVN